MLATLLLADLAMRAGDLVAFYTDQGVWPRDVMMDWSADGRWSLHIANGTVWWASLLFLVHAAAAACMALGYRTRLATIACWALLVSLQSRNSMVHNGGDIMLVVMFFWAMLLPLGAVASLDARHGRTRRARQAPWVSIASVGLMVQVVVVYAVSAIRKTGGAWREDGSALFYALNMKEMSTPLAPWMLEFPEFCRLLSLATYWIELVGPFLLFVPFLHAPIRVALAGVFVGFHLTTGLVMDLALFPIIGVMVWIVLLPKPVWDRFWPISARAPAASATRHGVWWRRLAIGTRECVAAAALALVVYGNVSVARGHTSTPAPLRDAYYATALRQRWTMFSPQPNTSTRWVRVEVTLRDGRVLDGFTLEPYAEHSPQHAREAFENVRWRKYLIAVTKRRHRAHRDEACRYFASRVEARLPGTEVERIRLIFFRLATSTEDLTVSPKRIVCKTWEPRR